MEDNRVYMNEINNNLLADEVETKKKSITDRINANPENVEQGLAKLVLTVIELLRRLMEKQAIRRIENNSLTEYEIEEMGLTFMKLEEKIEELKKVFNLEDEELNLNLGPLGDLM